MFFFLFPKIKQKSMADNMTVTSILYKPEVGDDGTIIICKAENPWVTRKPSVARKTMKIKCKQGLY